MSHFDSSPAPESAREAALAGALAASMQMNARLAYALRDSLSGYLDENTSFVSGERIEAWKEALADFDAMNGTAGSSSPPS